MPEGRRGDPGSETRIQAAPHAEVAAPGPWEGACGPLTDTQTPSLFTWTVPGHSTVKHHLSAFADTHRTRAPWVRRADAASRDVSTPEANITRPVRTDCTHCPYFCTHKSGVPAFTRTSPTSRTHSAFTTESLFTHDLRHYFHHDLTCVCLGLFPGFGVPPRYREGALKTILLIWSWEEDYITSWNSGRL